MFVSKANIVLISSRPTHHHHHNGVYRKLCHELFLLDNRDLQENSAVVTTSNEVWRLHSRYRKLAVNRLFLV